ncbi:MAG TPA: STAS domain-containing protein [Actinomycetota bacterium]|nr:STAS domain-containing protein [Actinomycetota bacterium]
MSDRTTDVGIDVPLHTRIDVAGDATVLRLTGALDIASEPSFSQEVESLRRDGVRALTIDIGALDFIDSRGLSALLRTTAAWTDEGRRIEVIEPRRPQVRHVFEVSGADDGLPFVAG